MSRLGTRKGSKRGLNTKKLPLNTIWGLKHVFQAPFHTDIGVFLRWLVGFFATFSINLQRTRLFIDNIAVYHNFFDPIQGW